jgi:acyl-CoA synthetase (AMP-forming)/AMP-acid ligase II
VHTAPLAHFAFTIAIASLAHGGTQHVMAKFDAAALLDLVETERIAVIPMVPTQVKMVVDEQSRRSRDVSSVRCIPYSAAPIAAGQLRTAIEVFGQVFVQLYAQSEVLPPVTVLSKDDHRTALAGGDERLLISAGRPLPYVDVKVVDADGNASSRERRTGASSSSATPADRASAPVVVPSRPLTAKEVASMSRTEPPTPATRSRRAWGSGGLRGSPRARGPAETPRFRCRRAVCLRR